MYFEYTKCSCVVQKFEKVMNYVNGNRNCFASKLGTENNNCYNVFFGYDTLVFTDLVSSPSYCIRNVGNLNVGFVSWKV